MFERFTEKARRVLFFSRYEASQLGDMQITPEHLLLGLLQTTGGVAARVFAERGIVVEEIRRHIESHAEPREKISTSVEIPFDTETKLALQLAAEEADTLRDPHIGTEHLLLGILRAEKSAAAAILIKRGLDIRQARESVIKLAGDAKSRSASSHRTEASILIRGMDQLLERLAAFTTITDEARSLIDQIRQRVRALERQVTE